MAYPDIKVGIPSMLLAVEMSIFAVMHIFAFSWKPYDIRNNSDPAAKYKGGFLGWKAFLDAFNLWDIVKASARGFRWLFVGARHREMDISYDEHRNAMKLANMDTQYPGPQYPSPQNQAPFGEQEFGFVNDPRPRPVRRDTNDSDDKAALLTNQQHVPTINVREPSPYREESPFSDPKGYDRRRGFQ
jgi:hypothetical protein